MYSRLRGLVVGAVMHCRKNRSAEKQGTHFGKFFVGCSCATGIGTGLMMMRGGNDYLKKLMPIQKVECYGMNSIEFMNRHLFDMTLEEFKQMSQDDIESKMKSKLGYQMYGRFSTMIIKKRADFIREVDAWATPMTNNEYQNSKVVYSDYNDNPYYTATQHTLHWIPFPVDVVQCSFNHTKGKYEFLIGEGMYVMAVLNWEDEPIRGSNPPIWEKWFRPIHFGGMAAEKYEMSYPHSVKMMINGQEEGIGAHLLVEEPMMIMNRTFDKMYEHVPLN